MADIRIEIVYATPADQDVRQLDVPAGTTLGEAVRLSRIAESHPAVDFDGLKKGVWYQVRTEDTVLQAGDRVEIYRPLIMEAKEARRKRAMKSREEK